MTSNDNMQYVTVEMFREGISELKTEIRGVSGQVNELKAEIRVLEREVAVNSAKIEMLQHTFYWGLGIIAVAAALAPLFKRDKTEQPKPELTMAEILLKVDERFDEKMSRLLSAKNQ